MEPITNEEKYLAALTGESVVLPEPITRKEIYLAAAAGVPVSIPDPITREEMYLSQIKPGDGSGVVIRNQNKTITENGSYKADSGYTGLGTVTVAVPIPEAEEPILEHLTVTENGKYTPGEGVDGFSLVNVDVQPPLEELTVSENGEYLPPDGIYGFSKVKANIKPSYKRTAWYRPPDWPDYSSLDLPEDEGYAFFTYDTQLPIDESLKKALLGWYFYDISDGQNKVNIDRGHIENGEFIIDERVLENQYYAVKSGVSWDLPADAGRFVVYRISGNNPTKDVRKFRVFGLANFADTPCVETFIWNGGAVGASLRGEDLTNRHTGIYTIVGSITEGGTSEFWNAGTRIPDVIVWDNVQCGFGYLPFQSLGIKCKAVYITNSELTMVSTAQNQFTGASGLHTLDFTGSTIVATSMSNCFSGCSGLRELDLSGWVMKNVANLTNAFKGMKSLVNLMLPEMPALSFSLSDSTLLSVDSLIGVIASLPTLEEGEAATLTLGETNTAKLTAEQLAVATEKGWTVA